MLHPTTTHYITQPNVNQNLAFNPESDLEAAIKIGNERTHTIGRLDNFVRLVRGKSRAS